MRERALQPARAGAQERKNRNSLIGTERLKQAASESFEKDGWRVRGNRQDTVKREIIRAEEAGNDGQDTAERRGEEEGDKKERK